MKKKNIKLRLGELFCGPGGIARGATNAKIIAGEKQYSISHEWATDYHPDTCETYRQNIFPNKPNRVICEDIRSLDFKKLISISEIDILAFGFPCNDFSLIGKQKGINGNYGPLYKYAVSALKFFKPQYFIAENVRGLKSANNGDALKAILSEIYSAGYDIWVHLYKFEEYGLPQTRHRIFIVGAKKELHIDFRIPKPTGMTMSCSQAMANIPLDSHNNEKTEQSKLVIERLKYIKPGENAFTAKIPPNLQLSIKGAHMSQIYKRLDANKPAYTITGSGGGGTHVYHWSEPRALTNRERARLQTFPDEHRFYGLKGSVRRQVGMAVPPKSAEIIFKSLLMSIGKVNYESIPANIEVKLHSRKEERQ